MLLALSGLSVYPGGCRRRSTKAGADPRLVRTRRCTVQRIHPGLSKRAERSLAWTAGPVRGVARVGAFSDPEDDESLVNFVAARLARDPVDLVAVFGDARHAVCRPAPRAVISGRSAAHLGGGRASCSSPSSSARRRSTVGTRYDLAYVVEDILQVLPATRQIVVVFGVSALERFWSDESRRAFARFENRVQFRWLEGLPVEAMKREVASLPRDSAVLYGMLLRDADGLSFEGRARFDPPEGGLERSGLRLLREPAGHRGSWVAGSIPTGHWASRPPVSRPGSFAARTRRASSRLRWRPGRRPSTGGSWSAGTLPEAVCRRAARSCSVRRRSGRLYRWYVLGVLAVVALQTLLITVLLLQRRRRNRAERQLAQSERRMHLITDSLPVLIAYVDRDQRYVFMNRAYEAWFGIDPESAAGPHDSRGSRRRAV